MKCGNKTMKCGIKIFVLADATNGYVKNFLIYTGKSVENDGNTSIGLCGKVFLDFMFRPYTRQYFYMDTFYTNPSLYLTLYDKGKNACGT